MAESVVVRRRSDEVTDTLRSALRHSGGHLALVPLMVTELIADNLWRDRPTRRGRIDGAEGPRVHFKTWAEFVRALPPAGLGEDPARLRAICRGTDAERALATVAGATHGGDRTGKTDNINLAPDGTARAYAYRRLERQRPDLYAPPPQTFTGVNLLRTLLAESGGHMRPVAFPVPRKPASPGGSRPQGVAPSISPRPPYLGVVS